jgi:DNA-binding winged helix-turn-helix (wHTH) protein/Tol biopolymer transport system component
MARYSFGPFSLDQEARVLLRDGKPVSMAGKTLDTLLVLVQNRGRLVDKDELLSRVWPDTVVEEANLSQNIFTIRKILGDTPKDRRYIATVAGRGYQFVAPVEESPGREPFAAPAEEEGRTIASKGMWLPLASVAILAVAGLLVFWSFLHHTRPQVRELRMRQLTTNAPELSILNATISPDGKYLAYGASGDIYLRLIATGETQVVPKPEGLSKGDIWFPVAWFPSGARILASSVRHSSDASVYAGWTVSVIGGSPTLLRDDVFVQSISPDGSLIAFTVGKNRPWEPFAPDPTSSTTNKEIWVMGAHGENARKIVSADDRTIFGPVRWSPDGRRLAYVKVQMAETGFPKFLIESRSLGGGEVSQILSNCPGPFAWAPDGRILYFQAEPAPDSQDANLWALSVDAKSGRPTDRPQKITGLQGFGIEQLSLTSDGKKLTLMKGTQQVTAYVGSLGTDSRVVSLRRLTLDDRPSFPSAWTRDSKAVIFTSNRAGAFSIYKQPIDSSLAELILTGSESVRLARVSPDGAWIVYSAVSDSQHPDRSASVRLMRVPVNGGAPEPILQTDARNFDFDCPRVSKAPCVLQQRSPDWKEERYSGFDPLSGRLKEIFRTRVARVEEFSQWTVAPDGSRLAITNVDPQQREIKIVSLSGVVERTFEIRGWPRPNSLDWTADSKALLMSFAGPSGATLGRVDFNGHVEALYTLSGSSLAAGISAPDGKHLAIAGSTLSGRNVWLLENF